MKWLLAFLLGVLLWSFAAAKRGRTVPTLPLVALSVLTASGYLFLRMY
jgi:hypothetical protein